MNCKNYGVAECELTVDSILDVSKTLTASISATTNIHVYRCTAGCHVTWVCLWEVVRERGGCYSRFQGGSRRRGVVGDGRGGRGWTCWETTVINVQLNTPLWTREKQHLLILVSASPLVLEPDSHTSACEGLVPRLPLQDIITCYVYTYTHVFSLIGSPRQKSNTILFISRCIAMFDTLLCRTSIENRPHTMNRWMNTYTSTQQVWALP